MLDYLSSASTAKPRRSGEALLEKLPIELLGSLSLLSWSSSSTVSQFYQHHNLSGWVARRDADMSTEKVIGQLAKDLPPTEYSPRNTDLVSCLLTSRVIHAVTSRVLYRHITIPHSKIFSKFLNHLAKIPELGKLVRRLDLSHFSSVGLGRTQQLNVEIQNMTSKTLLKCLELTPWIQEVLLQVHLAQDIDAAVVKKLFYGLPNLRSLDFCAAAAGTFVEAFSAAVTDLYVSPSTMLDIQNLSLHECFTLHSSDLEVLLSRLPRLRILDLHHTRVTDDALFSLPDTAELTHLNLGRCNGISGNGMVEFIKTHPAAKNLMYLNLSCDVSRYRLLWSSHVNELLPALPSTLRSLNLNGAHIGKAQLPLLLPLTKHLEELGLGYTDLSVTDVLSIFRPPQLEGNDTTTVSKVDSWTRPAIHYLDLTEVAGVTQPSLFSQASILLGPLSAPLEVIEVSEKVISGLQKATNANKKVGWVVRELGRRGWYVRERRCSDADSNDWEWKMGAKWWGMRKAPVAWGDVGGLYGHYMFKM